jgi:hypothetical protein
LHLLGRQNQWCEVAARLGLQIAARRRDGSGREVAASAEDLARKIVSRLTRQSAESVLATCLAEDGAADIDPATSPTLDRALRRTAGISRFSISLDRPLVALGASAPVYYPAIAEMLGAEVIIPADSDVANAIGAVVGQIRASVAVVLTCPEEGRFVLAGAGQSSSVLGEDKALLEARHRAHLAAVAKAKLEGADDVTVTLVEELDSAEVEGQRKIVEARITATASGRPRIAH